MQMIYMYKCNWISDYDEYDNANDYDDCDGDYDVLNLTQLLMLNSHSLLLSSLGNSLAILSSEKVVS